MNRRTLLAALASMPFVGGLLAFAKPKQPMVVPFVLYQGIQYRDEKTGDSIVSFVSTRPPFDLTDIAPIEKWAAWKIQRISYCSADGRIEGNIHLKQVWSIV